MNHIFYKTSILLNRWIEYSVFGLGFSMAMIVSLQVFFRYVLNQSLFWSEELARYLLVWLTFLGASVAYHRGVHPGIDIFSSLLSTHYRRITRILVHIISILMFVIMVVYGFKFTYFVRLQITPALHLPKWVVFVIIPISGIAFLIHGLAFISDEMKGVGSDY
jgi:TRAP-type C4-dicarboxylate transport system permease small subunit